MFNELKVFSNITKRNFLENFKTRIQSYTEHDQLRKLNKLFNFDKDNSPFLTNDTRIDIENFLIDFYSIIYNKTENILNIILCSTYLIGKRDSIKYEFKLQIYIRLSNMLLDTNIPVNLRMDIAENLTHPAVKDTFQETGREFIRCHGGVTRYDISLLQRLNINRNQKDINNEDNRDIYINSQNIHHPKITLVMQKSLKILEKDTIPNVIEPQSIFNIFNNDTVERLQTYEDCHKDYIKKLWFIPKAFNRIERDTSIFFPSTLTLKDIFQRIYNRITNSANKKELLDRLYQELTEMNETCASGHASRLLNVLSGFPEVELKFQPEITEELTKSINNLLEKYIKVEEQEYKDLLLDSMVEDKVEYHKYIDNKKEGIRDELEKEFQNMVIKEKYIEVFVNCIKNVKEK